VHGPDRDPDQPECGMTDGGGHPTDLPIHSFRKDDFQPAGRDALTPANGDRAGRDNRVTLQDPYGSRPCRSIPESHPAPSENIQGVFVRDLLYLNKVRSRVRKPGFRKPVADFLVVCQYQQPFALRIEPSNRIHPGGKGPEVLQCAMWGNRVRMVGGGEL
jgi:hypothetical protein